MEKNSVNKMILNLTVGISNIFILGINVTKSHIYVCYQLLIFELIRSEDSRADILCRLYEISMFCMCVFYERLFVLFIERMKSPRQCACLSAKCEKLLRLFFSYSSLICLLHIMFRIELNVCFNYTLPLFSFTSKCI